jgi:hypothetical protein
MLADHPHLQADLIAQAYASGNDRAFEAAVAEATGYGATGGRGLSTGFAMATYPIDVPIPVILTL